MHLLIDAALHGAGLVIVMEDMVAPFIADGRLVRVLEDWSPPFSGYHLYYPDRRHPSPAFAALLEELRANSTVFGRICLLGDAAFVVRPHTAGATAKAARDATVLATALTRARQNVDAGLRSFEDTQLEYGRGLVGYGVALGRHWTSKHARKPQP